MNNRYHFVTRWRFAGSQQIVYDIISDPLQYPRWWPTVYLEAEEIAHGAEGGLGRRIRLRTKGWLPYRLRWEALTIELDSPKKLSIQATGDFEGRGTWALEQEDEARHEIVHDRLQTEPDADRQRTGDDR